MSQRGSFNVLLAAGLPAAVSTALTTFEAYGNTVTLYIKTTVGGAGNCTFTLQSTHNGSDWFNVYDLDSAASWAINVNAAGNYEITLPVGLIPRNQYKLFYSCDAAAGTIAIDAVSWENPAGSTDIAVGDIHTSITDLAVEGDVAHDAVDSGNPVKVGGHARTSQRTAVANDDRADLTTDEYGQVVTANFVWADRAGATTETDPISTHYSPDSTTSTGAVANATPYDQIIDMDGYRGCEVQIEVTTAGVGDTFAVTYLASVQGSDAGDAWLDATTNGWNLVAGASLAVDHIMASEPFHVPRGHLVRITTAGGNDDMVFNVHVKTWY